MYRSVIVTGGLLMAAVSVPAAAEAGSASKETVAAKKLFGAARAAADLAPTSFGRYTRGCIAGAAALPADGATWQAMRLDRNRNWGHPVLVNYIRQLASGVPGEVGWKGLLIGDMSQPRGGPMLTGHASHQIGLDVDIWLKPMPDRRLSRAERQTMSAVSMIKDRRTINSAIWTPQHFKLIKRAASDPRVARIFVHPAIKQALCRSAGTDRSWLRRVRPWYGHNFHFHVRLKCPAGESACKNQSAPPPGDGCGKELAWWLSDKPYRKKPGKKPKHRQLVLSDLPNACRRVLAANDRPGDDRRSELSAKPGTAANARANSAVRAAAPAVRPEPVSAPPVLKAAPAQVEAALAPVPDSNGADTFFATRQTAPIPRRKPLQRRAAAGAQSAPAPIPRRKPPPPQQARSGQVGKDSDVF